MPSLDHWEKHAQNWDLLGPPLRPSPEDVAIFERIVANAPRAGRRLEVMLLGVTPELMTMRWPDHTQLTAVERSLAMIEMAEAYRKPTAEVTLVQQSDWRNMKSIAKEHFDLVVGDGCFTQLPAPLYADVLSQIHAVLRPGGGFTHRYFMQSEKRKTPAEALVSLQLSSPRTFHAHKLELLMANQESFEQGVRVADVWEQWNDSTREVFVNCRELLPTLDCYQGSKAVYTFPTSTELKQQLEPYFQVELVNVPHGYPLSDRCPVVTCLRKEIA